MKVELYMTTKLALLAVQAAALVAIAGALWRF
jgi:hypothetical protein